MATKLMLPRVLRKPEMSEPLNVIDIASDLALVRAHDDAFRIYFCVTRESDRRIVDPVARIHMPFGGFRWSLQTAATEFLLPDWLQ